MDLQTPQLLKRFCFLKVSGGLAYRSKEKGSNDKLEPSSSHWALAGFQEKTLLNKAPWNFKLTAEPHDTLK